jgi:hypothetical protein
MRTLTSAFAALVIAAVMPPRASTVPVSLAVAGRASATPSIAADGSRVAIAWGARDAQGAADVYIAVSRDAGRVFDKAVRVTPRSGTARLGGEMPPRVAIAGTRVDVLWTSRADGTRILAASSTDGGRSFGAARALDKEGAPGDRGWQALAPDGRGGMHAVWLDHRAAAGGGHHASPDKSAILYNGGGGEVEIATGVCYCCKTAVAARADGRVFAAWRHAYPGDFRDIAFSMSMDGGRTFAPPVRVSADRWQLRGCPDDGPAMSVDAVGIAHLAWPSVVDGPEPYKAIFYTWTEDGRSFPPRMRVSPAGHHAAHPQVVAHRAGITVVWDGLSGGQRRVFAARRSRSNRNFAPVPLSDDRVVASYPVAALVPDAIVVAWVEGGGADSRIAVRRISPL